MGLDNYASRSPDDVELTAEDVQAFETAAIALCGGFWSGGGASFRGKVYLDVVDRVAGVSLVEEWIPPEGVRRIAAALEDCDPARVAEESKEDRYPASESEVVELRRFFALCSERGLGLIGWS
jgi:hypothetical protein